nr:hypothetical protein [Kibdelosporangium sp. MJ126-NF4]CEL23217.1 hypothetical protein [Kibdelosporangium sp. MJ126-NF4]CTQ94380.1 hypothetical protein [Kibdelosporangium sp. MJ126-NF4]
MQGNPEQLSARHRVVTALAIPLVVGLLAVTGCQVPASSSAKPGPPTTSGASQPAVEWVDRLCGAILDYDSVPVRFEVDSSSPEAAIASLKRTLETMSGRIDDTVGKLREVGQAPLPGGDEAATSLVSLLEDRKTVVTRSLGTLGTINVADRAAATTALQGVAKDLQALKTPVNPLEGMGSRFPELEAAARSADNCTEISRVRASRSALPPTPSNPTEYPGGSSAPTQPPTSGSGTSTPPPSSETTYPTF